MQIKENFREISKTSLNDLENCYYFYPVIFGDFAKLW